MAGRIWWISDEIWGKMAPLIPEHKTNHPHGTHRKRVDIQYRKEESNASKNKDLKAHCWVIERTHSWMNCFRRVLTRWENKTENYEVMLHSACGLIVWN